MPLHHVVLINEALDDLRGYARSGNIRLFLKKLARLYRYGPTVGEPLGGRLTNWRKMVVGDRDWRILFTTDEPGTTSTIWVIGDRADEECYRIAQERVEAKGNRAEVVSLVEAMLQIDELMRPKRRR